MAQDFNDFDDGEERGRFYGGKTWTFAAALVVVFGIVAAGVWLWAIRDTGDAGPEPAPPGVELPAGYVGGREVVGGVPVGFAHSAEGAISAAATWTGYAFVYPARYRPEGITTVMGPEAPSIDPEGEQGTCPAGVQCDWIVTVTPLAVRGSVEGDTGVVEVLAVTASDFLNGPPPADLLSINLEIVSVTLGWDAEADDWRITTWDRRPLDAATEVTPDMLAGFQWLRSTGSQLTGTPIGLLTGQEG